MAYSNKFVEGLHLDKYGGTRFTVEKVTGKTIVVGVDDARGHTTERLQKYELQGDWGLLPKEQGGGAGLINRDAHERAAFREGRYAGHVLDARDFVR